MLKPFFCFSVFVSVALAQQTLSVSPNKRVEATIAKDAMNRLALENDRIAQVFGDEGTFVSQTDEATGQLFIKPTPENGDKPLSLTLISENGLTQDLLLKPSASEPQTIVLQGMIVPKGPREFDKALPLQSNIIALSKRALAGELSVAEGVHPSARSSIEGIDIAYQHSYAADSAVVHVFQITNFTDQTITLHEKFFYQPGV
jgi:type-F conjugative transfer system secretin TraK